MHERSKTFQKGESLVEVIMAIFVVAMGSAVATSLIISALQSNQFSRDNLIALNLAVEGIEAMRAIRDANWLKYSYDKPNCWNLFPDSSITSCSDVGAKQIAPDKYTVDLSDNQYGWSLTAVGGSGLDLSVPTGNDSYRLKYYDIDTSKDSDGDGDATKDKDILASVNSTLPAGGAALDDARFYRMVEISYPSCTFTSPFTTPPCEDMDIVSKVQWISQGVVHQVVLNSKLTNYQKVKVK